MTPAGPSPARVQRPAGPSRPRHIVSTPVGGGPLGALPAGPPGARPTAAGAAPVSARPRRSHGSCQQRSARSPHPRHGFSVWHQHAPRTCPPGVCTQSWRRGRLAPPPQGRQEISGKAHVRRCQRDRPRLARGQPAHQVVVARARPRVGFMGAMATEVPVTPSGHQTHRQGTQKVASGQRASAAPPPRCGVPRVGVKGPPGRRGPRVRPAADGGPSG